MKLQLGDELVWDGVTFELIAIDAKSARLRATEEGFAREVLVSELLRDPTVEWPSASMRPVRTFDDKQLAALPPEQRRKVEIWLPQVIRLDEFMRGGRRTADERALLVREIAQAVGAQLPTGSVDPRTVWRKLKGYRSHGVLGLINKGYREQTPLRRDPLLLEIVVEICRQADKQSTGTQGRIVDDIRYAIADRYGAAPPFVVPSDRTLRRIISEVPRAKHLTRSAKTRASLANRPEDEFGQHESPRLGEHVQIDSTKFDAEIMLDDGRVTMRGGTERPELTILLEIRSRTPLAAVVRAVDDA